MKTTSRDTLTVLFAIAILGLLALFLRQEQPIAVHTPDLAKIAPVVREEKKPEEVLEVHVEDVQPVTASGQEGTQPVAPSAQLEKQPKKVRNATPKQLWLRRLTACQTDDDCIIVDKDPCGCLVGPKGVMAINAEKTLDFDKRFQTSMTKACPDTPPVAVKECSPSAHPACQNGYCRIVY